MTWEYESVQFRWREKALERDCRTKKSRTTCLSHSFPLFCSLLFCLIHYIVSVWLLANTFFHHFSFLGKVFLWRWLLNVYTYIYKYIQQRGFWEKQWKRIRKRRHLLPWLLNFLGPKNLLRHLGFLGQSLCLQPSYWFYSQFNSVVLS